MRSLLLLIICRLLMFMPLVSTSYAQTEPVNTQYMFNQQIINPAYAGIWDKIGFNASVRKQWIGISGTPITETLSLFSAVKRRDIGLGLTVSNSRIGYLNSLNIYGDYAYEVRFNKMLRLRLGLRSAVSEYGGAYSRLLLDPNREYDCIFAGDVRRWFLNYGVGGFLYGDDFYLGFSAPKFLREQPGEIFAKNSREFYIENFHITFGYLFHLIQYNFLTFKPTLLFSFKRGAPFQYDLGLNWMLHDKIWLGLVVRSSNSVCFIINLKAGRDVRIGYSADFAFIGLTPYQFGTYEVMLSFSSDIFGRGYIRKKYF